MTDFEKALEAERDRPLSEQAKAFIKKVYICEPPCDSWGVCSNCCDKTNFLAGYNFGYDFTLNEQRELVEALESIKKEAERNIYGIGQSKRPGDQSMKDNWLYIKGLCK